MFDSRLQALEEENAALRRELATLKAPAADASAAPSLWSPALGAATLATLFSALPDYIFVVERETMRILLCNDVFAHAIGFASRENVEGQTIFACFPPADAARFAAQNETVFSTGQTLYEVERVDLPDGPYHFDTYKIPICDEQ